MQQVSRSIEHYRRIFSERTSEELRQLAHIKRFMERLVADSVFRDKLRDNIDNPRAVTDEYGIDADPEQMLPLFNTKYIKYRLTEEEAQWPLALAWDDYIHQMMTHRDMIRDLGDCPDANPAFDAWRQRQIKRSMSELGASGPSITHPIVAYELSKGCTVGCWFCGISADRFQSYWPYTEENAALWRGALGVMVDLFGEAAQTGFCYWATDPSDNPDYPKFIEDHYHITGQLPQTTTAAPLKNVEQTREVLALFDKYKCVTNRFSILNLKILDRVHAEFTPEELMGVELVTQNAESLTSKASAGRARDRQMKLRDAGKPDQIAKLSRDHSTIACVSGFLVNMLDRSVKMVSPTRGSKRWPLGYRVYAEEHFDTPDEYRAVVEDMIKTHMPDQLSADDVLSFRDDLEFQRLADGFHLEGASGKHWLKGGSMIASLGELVAAGDQTTGEIRDQLVRAGGDIFVITDTLHDLFENGLLNDDPALGGIGSGPKLRQAS